MKVYQGFQGLLLVFEIKKNELPEYNGYPFKYWDLHASNSYLERGRDAVVTQHIITLEK